MAQHRARERELRALPAPTLSERAELEALDKLQADLRAIGARAEPGGWPRPDSVSGVEARLEVARSVHALTVGGPEARQAWASAADAVARDARYRGLRLEPIEGLLPLGLDPESGLMELWHVLSGERPERGADGRLRLTEDSGMILVLVPPGEFEMGSTARKTEGPVHEVRLAPFLISKYELTQGQWLRASGENPSKYKPGFSIDGEAFTLLHPVEQVSWEECREVLARLGLTLPSEAQWEYACRAGTTSTWWTGDDPFTLEGAANLTDQTLRASGVRAVAYSPWEDGHALHAPVGGFRPNAFGLHDTVGNVCEWVQDVQIWSYEGAPRDGSAREAAPARFRGNRGGSWAHDVTEATSSDRDGQSPGYRSVQLGVRPARSLSSER